MVALALLGLAALAETRITNIGWGYTNVYAVEGDAGVVVVDAHKPGREDRILRRLDRAGIDRERVTLLVATHGHFDHAGSTAALAALLDVPVAGGAADAPYLTAGRAPLHPTGSRGALVSLVVKKRFPPTVLDLAVVDRLDLGAYGVAGEVRVVGGHTPGSVVVALDDGVLLSGDLIRSRLFRRHDPTLHFFHDDPSRAHEVLGDLVDDGATTLWPSHGGSLSGSDVADWLARTGNVGPAQVAARP